MGDFSKGALDCVRNGMDLPDYIQFVSDTEARVCCDGIFVFKMTGRKLYFYLLGDEKHFCCIATVRDKNDMVIAIEGFMQTFLYR